MASAELVASRERAERLWGVVRVSVSRTIGERSHITQQAHELRGPPAVEAPDHLDNGRPGGGAPEARRGGEGVRLGVPVRLDERPDGVAPEGALGLATPPPALREATQASSSPPDREVFMGDGEQLVQRGLKLGGRRRARSASARSAFRARRRFGRGDRPAPG